MAHKIRLRLLRSLLAFCLVGLFSYQNPLANAQYTATSLAQLRAFSVLDNATITMAPGEYWISGDRPDAAYFTFSGTNTTFDFSQAEFKIDTRDIAGYRDEDGRNADFNIIHITGSNLVIDGLNLSGYDLDLDHRP